MSSETRPNPISANFEPIVVNGVSRRRSPSRWRFSWLISLVALNAMACSEDRGFPVTPEDGTDSSPGDTGQTTNDSGDAYDSTTDDTAKDDTAPADTGTDDTGPDDACPSTTLTVSAVAAPTTIWAGTSTTITATGTVAPSGTIAYSWALTAKPSGSTATVSGSAATTKLNADLPGTYTVRVTASAACTESKTADVTLTVADAPVFYEAQDDLTSGNIGALTLRIAGAVSTPPVSGSQLIQAYIPSSYDQYGYNWHETFGLDVWEGTPGTPSRAVIAWYTGSTAGPGTSPRVLYAATSDSRDSPSASRPKILVGPIADGTDTLKLGQPRFAPDGSRVAYLQIPNDKSVKLATVAFDGSTGRTVSPYFLITPAGNVDATNTSRPQWLSNTVLGWARKTNATNWEVVTANDAASATPSRFFSCAGPLPRAFEFVTTGGKTYVLASYPEDTTGPADLILYEQLAGSCNLKAKISKLTGVSEFVRDFTLSPDQSKVAYIVGYRTTTKNSVYIANSDGTGTITKFDFTKPVGNAGPRFVAAGTRLVLTLDGEPSTFPLAATPIRTLQTKSAGTSLSHAGNGAACSTGGSPQTLALVGLAYAAALVINRRRRA